VGIISTEDFQRKTEDSSLDIDSSGSRPGDSAIYLPQEISHIDPHMLSPFTSRHPIPFGGAHYTSGSSIVAGFYLGLVYIVENGWYMK